jgi:hypothetical protein
MIHDLPMAGWILWAVSRPLRTRGDLSRELFVVGAQTEEAAKALLCEAIGRDVSIQVAGPASSLTLQLLKVKNGEIHQVFVNEWAVKPNSISELIILAAIWLGRLRRARVGASGALVMSLLKPAELSGPFIFRAFVTFILFSLIIAFRHFVDPEPFEVINSVLQIALIGTAMICGGVSAAIVALATLEICEFFLVDPAFTFGVYSWLGVCQLAVLSLIATICGIILSRVFRGSVLI